jgi:hypothetical protein
LLEQEQIPLDRSWRRLELSTQPSRGNDLLLHKNLQDLTKAKEALLRIICVNHRSAPLFRSHSGFLLINQP